MPPLNARRTSAPAMTRPREIQQTLSRRAINWSGNEKFRTGLTMHVQNRTTPPSTASRVCWNKNLVRCRPGSANVSTEPSPNKLVQDLIDGGCPPEMAASAASNPYAGLTPRELLARHWDPENHTWKWPPHDGFKDGAWTTTDHVPDGQSLDRIGLINERVGDFMGVEGDSYPARGLAPGTSGEYNVFRGTGATVPPGWEVRYGDAAPAFDQPGGATQWVVVDEYGDTIKIHTLVEGGIIEPVSGPYHDKWVKNQGRKHG